MKQFHQFITESQGSSSEGNELVIDEEIEGPNTSGERWNFSDFMPAALSAVNYFPDRDRDDELIFGSERPFDLQLLLSDSAKGKIILNTYQTYRELGSSERKLLADLILTAELGDDPSKKISTSRFKELAHQVATLFPTESPHVYYTSYRPGNTCNIESEKYVTVKKQAARGILYDKYCYLRRKFIEKGLIGNNRRRAQSSAAGDEDTTVERTECVEEKLEWLQTHQEPWHQVVDYWKATVQSRTGHLQVPDANVRNYFNKFPVLKQPNGLELLIYDFNSRFSELKNNFLESWPLHRDKIIRLLERKCRAERTFKGLVTGAGIEYEGVTDSVEKDVLAFKAIGFLLPCAIGPRDKTSNKSSRYSKGQASEAFLIKIRDERDLTAKIAARNECLEKFNLIGHPIPIVIGNGRGKGSCRINVGGCFYSFDSPVVAIDVCFKLFMALGISYPPEAKHIWTFIQKFLFRLTTPYDCNYPSLYQLAVELEIDK